MKIAGRDAFLKLHWDPPRASHGAIKIAAYSLRGIRFYLEKWRGRPTEQRWVSYIMLKWNDFVQVNSPQSIALTCRKCAQWTSMSTTSLSNWWSRSKLSFYRFKPALKTFSNHLGDSNYFLNLFLGNFTQAAQHPRHFLTYVMATIKIHWRTFAAC